MPEVSLLVGVLGESTVRTLVLGFDPLPCFLPPEAQKTNEACYISAQSTVTLWRGVLVVLLAGGRIHDGMFDQTSGNRGNVCVRVCIFAGACVLAGGRGGTYRALPGIHQSHEG